MEKICSNCDLPKDINEFGIKRVNSDGRSARCLLCTRQLYTERYVKYKLKKNIQKAIYRKTSIIHKVKYRTNYKENLSIVSKLKHNPCLDCGRENLPSFCMEFDHRDAITKFMCISAMLWNFSISQILAEIEKCDLVCRNCHRIRTKIRSNKTTTRRQKKLEFINSFKDKPCLDCSSRFPTECMDFDHAGKDKISKVTNMWSRSNEKIISEINKCELVCSVCHAIRTHSRGEHLPKRAA